MKVRWKDSNLGQSDKACTVGFQKDDEWEVYRCAELPFD